MLIATRWTEPQVLTDVSEADVYTEGVGSVTITCGFHDDPGTGESILIESERTFRNQAGTILRRDVERYVYEVAGGPPLEHLRQTWGQIYLPGAGGGQTKLLEEERTRFYPWNGFCAGANLSYRRELAAWVVYDLKPAPQILTQTQIDRLVDRGYTSNQIDAMPLHRVLDSARLWSQAIHGAEIDYSVPAKQEAVWVDPVETTIELVIEEADKFTIYRLIKSAIHPGDCRVEGPEYQRKEAWSYTLGIPIDPPAITATPSGDDGVRLEVKGGGAVITATIGAPMRVPPDNYRVERRVVSEPDRQPLSDPYGLGSDVGRAATMGFGSRRLFDSQGGIQTIGGTTGNPLPPQQGYSEPGDPSAPTAVYWDVIATLKNTSPWSEEGQAQTTDANVQTGGVYEYRAVAVIGQEESPPSQTVQATYSGATGSSGFEARVRQAEDGSVEVDVLAPVDPELLDPGYGETVTCDLPVDLTELVDYGLDNPYAALQDLCIDLATQITARAQASRLEATVEVGCPLITLERGQQIIPGGAGWVITGNGLVFEAGMDEQPWILDGFKLGFSRDADGKISALSTTLELVQP